MKHIEYTKTTRMSKEEVITLMESIGYLVMLPVWNKKLILTWPDSMKGCSILNIDNYNYQVEYYNL